MGKHTHTHTNPPKNIVRCVLLISRQTILQNGFLGFGLVVYMLVSDMVKLTATVHEPLFNEHLLCNKCLS